MDICITAVYLGGSGTDVVYHGRKVKAIVYPTLTRHLDAARGITAGEVYDSPIGESLDQVVDKLKAGFGQDCVDGEQPLHLFRQLRRQ